LRQCLQGRAHGCRAKDWGFAEGCCAFNPSFMKPGGGNIWSRVLTDPEYIVDLSMGQTAELLAHLFNISRERADSMPQ